MGKQVIRMEGDTPRGHQGGAAPTELGPPVRAWAVRQVALLGRTRPLHTTLEPASH